MKDYHQRPFTDGLLRHPFIKDQLPEKTIRIAIKDHIDRHRRINKKDEGEYEYSGSDDDESTGRHAGGPHDGRFLKDKISLEGNLEWNLH